ncbi:hypothetical protein BJY21_000763 [Kineosphaera limosa]|nr:hypothetical protein [Kineosphaera limosa]
MLEALANARAVTGADYLVLISGQDYPVRDLARWEQQVVDSGADALLDPLGDLAADWRFRWYMVPVPRPRHAGGYRAVRHLAWRLGRRTGRVLQVLPRFVEGDRRWLVGVPRLRPRPPAGLRVTKCSQWMTLSARAVDVALARDAREPALRAFFATVRISDESYLQSLLHDDASLAVRYSATTGRIIDPGSASPHLLDAAAVRAVALASDAPFVRKLARDDDAARAAADALLAGRDEPGELAPPRLPQFARAAAHHRPTLRSRPCR